MRYLYTLTPPPELMRKLRQLRPEFIISYPSILLELMAMYPAECRELGVSAIATNSEHSTPEQRQAISLGFGCPVFDEYSTEELVLGGFQCSHQSYHLQEDCAYLEILSPDEPARMPDGKVGEIVGTCLVNNVMPFIRYRQGDLASIRESDCPCGNNGRILSDIVGRKNSSFKFPDGTVVPSGRILDWTYKLVLEYQLAITQFQVVQQTMTQVDITVVTGPGYLTEQHDELLVRSFREQFGTFLSVRVHRVGDIGRTAAGKHIPIKSFVE